MPNLLRLQPAQAHAVESAMRSLRPVKVVLKGQTYNGSYEVEDGEVRLSSAYGSAAAKAGKDPAKTAEGLLTQAINGWRP